jgi:hypothetical protein
MKVDEIFYGKMKKQTKVVFQFSQNTYLRHLNQIITHFRTISKEKQKMKKKQRLCLFTEGWDSFFPKKML